MLTTLPHHAPVIIDLEASGFGRGSYPIEVGVALEDGRTRCFLIHPTPEWTHWDKEAEAMHGISRELLLSHGQPVRQVAEQLNELLLYKIVYSDAWGHDQSWLALLFDAAGLPRGILTLPLGGKPSGLLGKRKSNGSTRIAECAPPRQQ